MFTAWLFAALTASLLLSCSHGHYLSPYDFLQHDLATIKLGKASPHTAMMAPTLYHT